MPSTTFIDKTTILEAPWLNEVNALRFSPDGSSLLGYLPAGTGAVATTVQSKLRESVSIYSAMTAAQITDTQARTASLNVTSAIQAVIDSTIASGATLHDLHGGTFLVNQITLNGTGSATPANSEYSGLRAFDGAGRYNATVFKANNGYVTGQFVVKGNNLSGKNFRNFSVNGNGIADSGLDLSWIGGSSGNPSLAPSNQNILENVMVEGCSLFGLNLDQFHDSKISGVWVRGVTNGNTALSLIGSGGQLVMDNVWLSSGLFKIAAQNAGISNCGFFGGVQLTGSGYNHITWSGCHFYPDMQTTGITLNSTAIGNATRGNSFDGCYFNGCTYLISGLWHEGATFKACKFSAWASFADNANIVPAGGAGQIPVFTFESCSFEGATPVSVAGKFEVRFNGCKTSVGTILSDYGNFVNSGVFVSSGVVQNLGASRTISKTASVAIGGNISLPMGGGSYILTVVQFNPISAATRTSTTFSVGSFQGDGFAATVISTNTGSGAACPFTVAHVAGENLVITNTSGIATTMYAALFGVGF